jgi:hypothetical protein
VLLVRGRSMSGTRGVRPLGWPCAAALAVSLPTLASAAVLRYEAPPECPAAMTLQEETERLLGFALADAATIEVRVQITRTAKDHWRVVLTVQDDGPAEPRTRVLSGHSCAEAADAAAIAAAIAIRTRAPELALADAGVERSTTRSELARDPARAPRPPAAVPKPAPVRFGLGASLLLDTRTLPSLAVGFEAAGLADFPGPALRAMLFGGLLGNQEAHLSTGRGAKFDLLYAGLGACGWRSLDRLSALLCVGIEAGALRGEGLVDAPRVGSSVWLAPRLEVGLALPLLAGFSFTARGGLAFPLFRKAFVVDGDQVVHRPAGLTGRVAAGLELTL